MVNLILQQLNQLVMQSVLSAVCRPEEEVTENETELSITHSGNLQHLCAKGPRLPIEVESALPLVNSVRRIPGS